MKTDYREAIYSPVEQKTFRSALMNFLQKEFPNMGGPLIIELFIDKVESLIEQFYPPTKHLKMGQLLWFAVAKDEKPTYGKSMQKTRIVPVILTLVNHDDISRLKNKIPMTTVKRDIMARLYQEADDQGGTLSEIDISLMLMISRHTVSKHTLIYEKERKTTLPRRGTIHDMGTSMSHKRLICKKRKIERKSTSLVAQETSHSPEAVERYNLNLDRVAFCLGKRLSIEEASFVTGLSKKLIIEYRNLDQEINNSTVDNTLTNTIDFDDIPF
jgi:hypothetical protein